MMSLPPLIGKKLLLVTGKGGIGKSLVAASLGALASAQGKKVCLVETAAHDQLAPLLGHKPVGHNQKEILPNLYSINLDHRENFKDYLTKQLGLPKLVDKLFSRPVVHSLLETLPGVAEIMTLGRLYYTAELAKDPAFDLVIFDGFASGHFHTLMTTPDAVLEAGFVGPVHKETQKVRDFLANSSKCGIVVVTVGEPLVVKETVEFLAKFSGSSPTPIDAVVLNRWFEAPEARPADAPAVMIPAFDYLATRSALFQEGLTTLIDGMRRETPDAALYCLPDQGIWEEPLTPSAALEWWHKRREVPL